MRLYFMFQFMGHFTVYNSYVTLLEYVDVRTTCGARRDAWSAHVRGRGREARPLHGRGRLVNGSVRRWRLVVCRRAVDCIDGEGARGRWVRSKEEWKCTL